MAIEEMVLLNMTFDHQDLDQVLLHLKSSKNFYPQPASKIVNKVKDVQAFQADHLYTKMLDRLIQIASDIELELTNDLPCQYAFDIEKQSQYLSELEGKIKEIKDIQGQLIEEKEENEKTLEMLKHLSLLDVNLDQLLSCQYVSVQFGRIKKQNLDKLRYYDDHPFIFHQLGEDRQYIWCCYIVTHSVQLEVNNIFQALGFENIKIPSFVHGTIEGAKEELKTEIQAMQEYILRMNQKISVLRETHKVDLLKLYATIVSLKELEEYKVFVVDYHSVCAIYGFIPKRALAEFKKGFDDIESVDYQELPADIFENQKVEAPTIVHNAKIVEPFQVISHVTQTDAMDTTSAFAILYYAVFMVFLGDLGVGAVMVLFGLLMRKKKMGPLLLSLGLATVLGGLLYGNIFYMMSLYPAIALPLSAVYRIVDGIILLIVGTFTIHTFVKMRDEHSVIERILSIKGICGLIMVYACLIYFGCVYEIHWILPFTPFVIVIVACLVLIFVKSLIMKRSIK